MWGFLTGLISLVVGLWLKLRGSTAEELGEKTEQTKEQGGVIKDVETHNAVETRVDSEPDPAGELHKRWERPDSD
jgi:hypothetical protein